MNKSASRVSGRWFFWWRSVLGASLWAVWMIQFVRKTRANRIDGFFVPMAGQSAPPTATNSAGTNSK